MIKFQMPEVGELKLQNNYITEFSHMSLSLHVRPSHDLEVQDPGKKSPQSIWF